LYIDELETPLVTSEDGWIDEPLPGSGPIDPMDSLIEDLRGEFKRQLVRQTQERETAKHKRLVALTLVIAPMGLMMAAALIGRAAAHQRVEANREQTRYSR
jgi:hypothetical protein